MTQTSCAHGADVPMPQATPRVVLQTGPASAAQLELELLLLLLVVALLLLPLLLLPLLLLLAGGSRGESSRRRRCDCKRHMQQQHGQPMSSSILHQRKLQGAGRERVQLLM
jgi:hypothetical protein